MATRRFYADPLAAAWMAKHHGMKFHDADFDEPTSAPPEEIAQWGTEPIFIHPDSLHLLEPQVGDMISHFGLRAWRIDSMDDYAYFHPSMPNESIGRFTLKADKPQIIHRNGIAFHWPESEAA